MINHTEGRNWRYKMRNEIENIIKEQEIDRKKFHEVEKNRYEQISRKIYYAFCDYEKYPAIQMSYMWTRLRNNLKQTEYVMEEDNWNKYIDCIDFLIPDREHLQSYYLIVDGDWVYEGELKEIKRVLCEYPMFMEDFYLFPKNYKWLIIHCDEGRSRLRVW